MLASIICVDPARFPRFPSISFSFASRLLHLYFVATSRTLRTGPRLIPIKHLLWSRLLTNRMFAFDRSGCQSHSAVFARPPLPTGRLQYSVRLSLMKAQACFPLRRLFYPVWDRVQRREHPSRPLPHLHSLDISRRNISPTSSLVCRWSDHSQSRSSQGCAGRFFFLPNIPTSAVCQWSILRLAGLVQTRSSHSSF